MGTVTVYLGMINGKFYHTYSKRLRDKYLGRNYIVIYTMGTGKEGGLKIRGSESLKMYEERRKSEEVTEIVRADENIPYIG